MKYENGDIIRYVQVKFVSGYPSWYIDPNDEVETGDWVNVLYRYQEQVGEAAKVVRCVYPYVEHPAEETMEILEIIKRSDRK